jgi:hypothetical protein
MVTVTERSVQFDKVAVKVPPPLAGFAVAEISRKPGGNVMM